MSERNIKELGEKRNKFVFRRLFITVFVSRLSKGGSFLEHIWRSSIISLLKFLNYSEVISS